MKFAVQEDGGERRGMFVNPLADPQQGEEG